MWGARVSDLLITFPSKLWAAPKKRALSLSLSLSLSARGLICSAALVKTSSIAHAYSHYAMDNIRGMCTAGAFLCLLGQSNVLGDLG